MKKEAIELSIDLIKPNRYQPRLEFKEEALQELAQSIRTNGLIQPIVVRRVDNHYEIIAGERRYRASILAGHTSIAAIVANATHDEVAEMALVENIQRENLSAIEEAKAYLTLMKMQNITQAQMAVRVGKTQSTVANKIRLLQLDDKIQDAVSARKISERHARAMIGLPTNQQEEVLERIEDKKWSVKQTEHYIEKIREDKKPELVNKGIARHIKLGINTINQAVTMIEKTGITVKKEEIDSENEYKIIITFKK